MHLRSLHCFGFHWGHVNMRYNNVGGSYFISCDVIFSLFLRAYEQASNVCKVQSSHGASCNAYQMMSAYTCTCTLIIDCSFVEHAYLHSSHLRTTLAIFSCPVMSYRVRKWRHWSKQLPSSRRQAQCTMRVATLTQLDRYSSRQPSKCIFFLTLGNGSLSLSLSLSFSLSLSHTHTHTHTHRLVETAKPFQSAQYYLATAEIHEIEEKYRDAGKAVRCALNMYSRARE